MEVGEWRPDGENGWKQRMPSTVSNAADKSNKMKSEKVAYSIQFHKVEIIGNVDQKGFRGAVDMNAQLQ